MPALMSVVRIKADIEVDNVKAEKIRIYVVPDDVQSIDLDIGWTWLDLPHIAYAKIGKRLLIGCQKDELLRNFPIDEKINRVCLKRLETAQLESESLQIKDSSRQKMMGNMIYIYIYILPCRTKLKLMKYLGTALCSEQTNLKEL
ncbi:hypothetical protein AVEN_127758-1 [Araneus ventricosus]|uniref:Uncharacterized protein n=1 Tax=Araneus ventricosus TaxID=182803 RepID=A0A4Y2ECD8_ARAVE|nr:hypothetical protein AVEN_127758-1 [Araneus ventricosus]